MGWSCSAKASRVMEALSPPKPFGSNEILGASGEAIGFFEGNGKEYPCGKIVGAVWRYVDAEKRVVKAGSFCISAVGKIERFPLISAKVKAAAEAIDEPGVAMARRNASAFAAFEAEFGNLGKLS